MNRSSDASVLSSLSFTTADPSVAFAPCRHGPMFYFTQDGYIGRSLREYGEYSEHEFELLRQLIGPGDTVVEVGSNIGALTVPLARCLLPQGRLYAIEAQRRVFQLLCANLVINGLPNVHALHGAGSDGAAYISMAEIDYSAPGNFGGVALRTEVPRNAMVEMVQPYAVDDLGLAACKLIKIDVEGMELEVVRSAEQTIRKLRPFLYVENDRADRASALIESIRALGYRLWWHLPLLFNPRNFAGNAENLFPGVASLNMLCAQRELAFEMQDTPEILRDTERPAGLR
jgi:FkbM family methyltransferase